MNRKPSEKYLEKARLIDKKEAERLLSRMKSRLLCKMRDETLTPLECLAIQLEIEDEQLMDWRARTAELREKESSQRLELS